MTGDTALNESSTQSIAVHQLTSLPLPWSIRIGLWNGLRATSWLVFLVPKRTNWMGISNSLSFQVSLDPLSEPISCPLNRILSSSGGTPGAPSRSTSNAGNRSVAVSESTPLATICMGNCSVPSLLVSPTTRLMGSEIARGPSGRNVQPVSKPLPWFSINLVSFDLRGWIGDVVGPTSDSGPTDCPQFPANGPSLWHCWVFCARTWVVVSKRIANVRIVFLIGFLARAVMSDFA